MIEVHVQPGESLSQALIRAIKIGLSEKTILPPGISFIGDDIRSTRITPPHIF
jgi:hypothetical protein